VVAVAVVAQAVWEMAKTLCRGVSRMGIMALAASVAFLIPTSLGHLGVIALAGVSGSILFKPEAAQPDELQPMRISPGAGILFLSVFFVILSGLPFLAVQFPNRMIEGIEAFYRSGALVFGGGHVVLPGLQASVLAKGFVDPDTFLAGYGAAQAVPGPLFSFAAFLGASMKTGLSAWAGGLLCLSAIFAPSFLLVFGSLPFWEQWRRNGRARAAMTGIHAAVVGILLAAWCRPVCTSALRNPFDFITALLAFLALVFWRVPTWLVVFACGSLGLFLDEPLTPP
jgi:chromate transporter